MQTTTTGISLETKEFIITIITEHSDINRIIRKSDNKGLLFKNGFSDNRDFIDSLKLKSHTNIDVLLNQNFTYHLSQEHRPFVKTFFNSLLEISDNYFLRHN